MEGPRAVGRHPGQGVGHDLVAGHIVRRTLRDHHLDDAGHGQALQQFADDPLSVVEFEGLGEVGEGGPASEEVPEAPSG